MSAVFRVLDNPRRDVLSITVENPVSSAADASVVHYPKPPEVKWSLRSYPYADPSLDDKPADLPASPPEPKPAAHPQHRQRHRNRR